MHFDKGGFLDRLSNFFIPPYPAPPADNGGYPANVDISKPYIGNPHLAAQGAKAGAVPAKPVAPVANTAPAGMPESPGYNPAADSQAANPQMGTPNYDATTEAEDQGFGPIQNNPPGANMEVSPDNDYVKQYADYLKQRQEGVEKNYQNDKYMALLQAGLGMMGGTSPYAAANIGQGASQGVSYMANANRQRGAEENAILSGKLGLTRADLYNKMHTEQMKQAALARGDRNEYNRLVLAENERNHNMQAILKGQTVQNQMEANKIKHNAAFQKGMQSFVGSPEETALIKDLKRQGGENWRSNPKLAGVHAAAQRTYATNNLNYDDSDSSVPHFNDLMQ